MKSVFNALNKNMKNVIKSHFAFGYLKNTLKPGPPTDIYPRTDVMERKSIVFHVFRSIR